MTGVGNGLPSTEGDSELQVVRDRKVMARSGICLIAYLYDPGRSLSDHSLTVETRGMPDVPEIALSLKAQLGGAISEFFVENGDPGDLEEYLGAVAEKYLRDRFGLRPLIVPYVGFRDR